MKNNLKVPALFSTTVVLLAIQSIPGFCSEPDRNMQSDQVTVTDHFDLDVFSFLSGEWVSKVALEKTESSWKKPAHNEVLATNRRYVDSQIADEFVIKSSSSDKTVVFSFNPLSLKALFSKELTVNASIKDYSGNMVQLEFEKNSNGLKSMTYRLQSPTCLKLLIQKTEKNKLVSETIEFKKTL
ncbi:MAG: hypothetical protein K8F91_11890 [Candidatus Obscuribacterales bacterium]|nr:hypothetical protein [Candidatus Obscuribacterales bacterium]